MKVGKYSFLSICSGIEAASVAFGPLGWKAAAFAEIEPFPCAVLAHHYPDVPNLGDMTKISAEQLDALGKIDLVCGGTPCQAFSVAGLRQSLSDGRGRGNLALDFIRICDLVSERNPDALIFWENVPGVLSVSDNAFGCFLGGLVGADAALLPGGNGKWPGAGVVAGPKRSAVWRVLDAQHFGVPQRRRRVFVLAGRAPAERLAEVLLERESLRGNPAPRREAREDVAGILVARTRGGGGLGTDFDLAGGLVRGGPADVAPTLRAGGNRTGGDRPPGTDVDTVESLVVTHALTAGGFDAFGVDFQNTSLNEDLSGTLDCAQSRINKGHGVRAFHSTQDPISAPVSPALSQGNSQGCGSIAVCEPMNVALRGREGGGTAEVSSGPAMALRASGGGGDKPHVLLPAPFDPTSRRPSRQREGVRSPDRACSNHGGSFDAPLAFNSKDHGADAGEVAPTLRAAGHTGSHANAGAPPAVCITGDRTHALKAEGADASEDETGRGNPIVAQPMAFRPIAGATRSIDAGPACPYLKVGHHGAAGHQVAVQQAMSVRRLTPVECSRLQGFPDSYLDIEYRGKPAADGPKYKALGNSWAVPCVAWIGRRIDLYFGVLSGKGAT